MKTVDDTFLSQQNKITGSRAVEEVKIYRKYMWPIIDVVDTDTFKVRGNATSFLSLNDWIIITTRKFSSKFRMTAAASHASGETTLTSTAHGLTNAQDIGGYVAKRYNVSRQVLKMGSINQGFEGQTLNQFRTGGSTIEMNDRAYITLYDEINETGVFFQKSWNDTISAVTPGATTSAFTVTTGDMTPGVLVGYGVQFLSGSLEGKIFPILTEAVPGLFIAYGDMTGAESGDEIILAVESVFYLEILCGFKGAL